MARTLIENGLIIPMKKTPQEKGPKYFTGEIALEDDLIVHLGEPGTLPSTWNPENIIDAEGKAIFPGFINCHTHAAMTLLRGYADDYPLMKWLEEKIWPIEAKMTKEDIYWGTMLAVAEMLRSGTTLFVDMYDKMDEVAKAVRETGIRAILSRGLIGLQDNAPEALQENIELARNWHNSADGRILVMFGPHAPYTCPPEFMQEVIKEAHRLNLGVHIHLAETKEEISTIKEQYRQTPVALMEELGLLELPVLAAHCVHVSAEDINILKKYNTGIAHCPKSNMKLASGTAPVPLMLAEQLKVGLGTDGASSNNRLDMLEEMRSTALLHKVTSGDPTVLPAYQALYLATRGGAEALGVADRMGSLEKGKKADMVMLDLEKPHLYPLHDLTAQIVYAASSDDIDTVMVDGKILVEKGELKVMDINGILENIAGRAKKLVE